MRSQFAKRNTLCAEKEKNRNANECFIFAELRGGVAGMQCPFDLQQSGPVRHTVGGKAVQMSRREKMLAQSANGRRLHICGKDETIQIM